MTKNVIPKTLIRPIVSGRYYARNPNDSTGPSAPTQLQAVPHDTTINLQWVNGVDPDTGLSGTLVQYRVNGTLPWTAFTVPYVGTSPLSSTYSLPNLTPLTAYNIQVTNLNNASPQVPSAPTSLTVSTTASDPALAPGIITLAVTQVSAPENSQIGISLVRSGAGASSQSVDADWAFSGFGQGGTPSPANGTVSWAAGENGPKAFTTTTGTVGQNVTGLLQVVDAIAPSGLQPTIGTPNQASVTVVNVSGTGLKWNPGYYFGSQNPTYADDRKLTQQVSEQNMVLSSGPNVLGWNGYYYPACFQTVLGSFSFTQILRDLNRLRSMAVPKRLILTILPQFYGSASYASVVPASVYNSSSFGPSPVAGTYGWWTIHGGAGMTLAFWRPAVMDWVISLFQALGAAVNSSTGLTVDADPYVEFTSFGELGAAPDAGDATYSPDALIAQYKRLIDAINVAWPTTIHACQNNHASTPARAQDLTNYCYAHRTALGGPDTYVPGQKSQPLTYGQAAAIGIGQSDPNFQGPDLRGKIAMMSVTQGPEISNPARYTMYTPHSFYSQINNVLQQSHMIITGINLNATDNPIPAYPADGPNSGANPGNWHSFLQVINGNPLTHVAKPSSLP